jgi:hypothetical protein
VSIHYSWVQDKSLSRLFFYRSIHIRIHTVPLTGFRHCPHRACTSHTCLPGCEMCRVISFIMNAPLSHRPVPSFQLRFLPIFLCAASMPVPRPLYPARIARMVTSAGRFFMSRIFSIDSIQLTLSDESLLFETVLEINHKEIYQNQHLCFQYTCMR